MPGAGGITPAHAGKSRLAGKVLPARRDHPRTRGEKHVHKPPHHIGVGITPAHAGKSAAPARLCCPSWDHPRTRGEKTIFLLDHASVVGSPPHTRGKETLFRGSGLLQGITPAHAGKSVRIGVRHHPVQDHPRTRGEKWGTFLFHVDSSGSPPHTRGKVRAKV